MESEARVGAAARGVRVAVAGELKERCDKKSVNQGANLNNSLNPNRRSMDRSCFKQCIDGHAQAARRVAEVFVWVSLVLGVMLGLSGALLGLLRVDVIELVFGVMTPAARVVYALLGAAAVYCAIATALSHPFKGAGR